MKKNIFYVLILVFSLSLIACMDTLPDEQFEKTVNLVKNGWIEQNIDVSKSGIIEVPVVVSVSGTSNNNQNISVAIDFDDEGLAAYNYEKYKAQEELYYSRFPVEAVSFESKSVDVVSGENTGLTYMYIDLSKVTNKYEDYVIPIRINNATNYGLGEEDYITALYHINFKNSFSGDFTGEITVAKTRGSQIVTDESNKLTVAGKRFYAISPNECYFYAGQIDRLHIKRDSFIVNVIIEDNDSITLSSPIPELQLVREASTITVTKRDNVSDQRYETVTTVFKFQYIFYDLTQTTPPTTSERHILRSWGVISMTQDVLKTN